MSWLHVCALKLQARSRNRVDCERPQEKPKEIHAVFAVSFPLVSTKLFHGLDPMAQHAVHGSEHWHLHGPGQSARAETARCFDRKILEACGVLQWFRKLTVALSGIAWIVGSVFQLRMHWWLHENGWPQKWWSVRIVNAWFACRVDCTHQQCSKTLFGFASDHLRSFELNGFTEAHWATFGHCKSQIENTTLSSSFEHQIFSFGLSGVFLGEEECVCF